MTDELLGVGGLGKKKRLKDMGDGSVAEVTAPSVAQLPASLGAKTAAASLSVALASDQGAVPPYAATGTDRSGTITLGGTAQAAAALNASRRYFVLQNTSPTEELWFNYTAAAVIGQPSFHLSPYESWVTDAQFCPTGAISVIAATTAHPFTAKEA